MREHPGEKQAPCGAGEPVSEGACELTRRQRGSGFRVLSEYPDLISTVVESHHGRVVHHAGNAVLAGFDAVVDVMSAAVAIQREL